MSESENAYGMRKRISFVQETIKQHEIKSVLDIGCGTGEYLTTPLAETFPDTSFYALDSDKTSIDYAKGKNQLNNLVFADSNDNTGDRSYDLVMASEVIEHVEHPGEFLRYLRSNLNDTGIVVVTTPNGYGPFELASLFEALLYISGIHRIAQRIKQMLFPVDKSHSPTLDTLAISPHLNFFSLRELHNLFEDSGLRLVSTRSRTFLCGYLLDSLLRSKKLLEWNARFADRLPHSFNSDWMFVLEKAQLVNPVAAPYQRSAYANFRKRLSLKRWSIKS